MKRLFALMLALVTALTLYSCGHANPPVPDTLPIDEYAKPPSALKNT